MTEYLRLFQSAVDPADLDELRQRFADEVRPVLLAHGCLDTKLVVNLEKCAGGLVEGASLSRWSSVDVMEAALASEEVNEALVGIRRLLRQEPVAKVLEVLE